MKEEDIDKIFREALQNEVEPTTPADWENFEKSLPANGSPGFLKYGLLGLFGLIALAGMTFWTAYNFGSQEKRQYVERDAISESKPTSKRTVNTNLTANTNQKAENGVKGTPYPDGTPTTPDNADMNQMDSSISGEKETLESTDLSNSNPRKSMSGADGRITSGKVAASTNTEIGNSTQNQSKSEVGKIQNESKSKNEPSRAEMAGFDSNENEITKSTTPTSDEKLNQDAAFNEQTALNRNVEKINLQRMNPLTGIIPQSDVEDHSPENPENPAFQKPSRFEPILFIGIEQNAVLITSLQAGVIGQLHLSKWSVGVGVALQRSGTLNWMQTSTSTSYGFQKYESTTRIRTESIDVLSFPVKLTRRIGGLSQVFIGYSPAFVVNARQQKTVIIDGTPVSSLAESGYLYNTGAPNFISFCSAGYGYDLNERWNLEIGINASFQKWKTSDKTPVGGFLRLNYRFK